MKSCQVIVRWQEGLHLRRAARLVLAARQFRSTLHLTCAGKIADARSILSLLALCATMGTPLNLEAVGDDEQAAVQAIERVFLSVTDDDGPGLPP